ncbi:ferredoxin [Dactylosporangium sp. CA-233914]|uniref:ferredoxin n=1 Tax=Dactylosporangium sp. CA-233914 TaxID=3239934 RepID=UPI003D93FAA0
MVKLTIDQRMCQGHGRCYGQAPTLIECDDQGYPVVPENGVTIPDRDLAEEIVDNCPEQAITVHTE